MFRVVAEDSARNLCLLGGECLEEMIDSAAPRAVGVYIIKGELWVGDVNVMEVKEQDPWKILLLLAAMHAVFNLRFIGVGRNTLTLLYSKVLGFLFPLTWMGKEVWRKLTGGRPTAQPSAGGSSRL